MDLAEVTYLSPDGCTALFTALRAAHRHGTRLVITHPDAQAQKVLWQIGLTPFLARAAENGDAETR